jgi:hypothetical protein
MTKKSLVCFFFIVFIALALTGCSNSSSPTNPNDAQPTPGMIIYSAAVKENNSDVLQLESFLLAATDGAGNTLSTACVGMWGPNGQIGLPGSAGTMSYSSTNIQHYVPDATYYVSVTHNSINYFGSFKTPNDVVIANDGSTIAWDFPASVAVIAFTDPVHNMYSYGPNLTSPFDVNATGLYNAGPGNYGISITIEKDEYGFIPVSGVQSIATTTQFIIKQITK